MSLGIGMGQLPDDPGRADNPSPEGLRIRHRWVNIRNAVPVSFAIFIRGPK